MVKLVTQMLAAGTLLLQIALTLSVILFLLNKKGFRFFYNKLLTINYSLLTVLTLAATAGSLYFSEIAKYPICRLCWYQRILMYPQIIFLLVAIVRKEKNINYSLLTINLMGVIVSAYHYILQWLPEPPLLTCGPEGNCATTVFRVFGYITIPLMAFTVFLANTVILFFSRNENRPGAK